MPTAIPSLRLLWPDTPELDGIGATINANGALKKLTVGAGTHRNARHKVPQLTAYATPDATIQQTCTFPINNTGVQDGACAYHWPGDE